ncbi:MAG: DUF4445 domain-containing protein [Deltaproteobacteria bacterium]|nr:DUF4445 domain-containing protein [Deltaproteobacteria bacterium]
MRPKKGVAFDIGTTTIAGASVDIASGSILGTLSLPNPQKKWGRDVLARINAVKEDASLLGELQKSVVNACNVIIQGLGLRGEEIDEIVAAGNPVMEHILLNISPEPLSRVPYRPAFLDSRTVSAKESGFEAGLDAKLYAFPFIGGFVGGDAVAVALSLGLKDEKEAALAIDIGTNSEIILSAGGELFATSAAAGPAFEGGGIKYGITAERGAIEGVVIDGEEIRLDVIGDVAPKGICGSGLVDAVSELIKAGIIDLSGRIKGKDEVATNLSARIRETPDGSGNSFVLYRGASTEVSLSQPDIRALQAAKSAIKAGISMLLKKAKTAPGDVKKVYIAGAFGSHLKPEGLKTIGILDESWLNDIRSVGDAALDGAVLAFRDDKKRAAETLAKGSKYVSLSGSSHFEREFIRNMNF